MNTITIRETTDNWTQALMQEVQYCKQRETPSNEQYMRYYLRNKVIHELQSKTNLDWETCKTLLITIEELYSA